MTSQRTESAVTGVGGQHSPVHAPPYAASALNWLEQTYDGRMDYSAVTTTTIKDLLGREPTHLVDWAVSHRPVLLRQLDEPVQ